MSSGEWYVDGEMFAEVCQQAAEYLGVDAEEFMASMADVSSDTLYQYRHGGRPSIMTLLKICNATGTDPRTFFQKR